MTGQSLFLEPPELEKQALGGATLSNDPTNWESEIVMHVHERHPGVARFSLSVRLEKTDDKLGYAYGFLVVSNQGQSQVHIPVVVKDWELAPLDVFIKGDEFFPLSSDRLAEALADPRMFSGSVPPADTTGGYAENYPPHSGRYVYASATGSVLDAVAATVSPEDRQHFFSRLSADERLLANYQKHGHGALIQKLARAGYDAGASRRPVLGALAPDVLQLEKVGYDQFVARAVSDRLYAPVERSMAGQEVLEKFGQEALTAAVENTEHCIVRGVRPGTPVILEDLESPLQLLEKFGPCQARTELNDPVNGWLFPRVVTFDGQVLDENKLFLDGQTIWSVQARVAGLPREASECTPMTPPSHALEHGVTGVFYSGDGQDGAFCTVPFSITSVPFDLGNYIRMEICTMLGECYTVEISDGVTSLTPGSRDRYLRLVPARMKFCRVGRSAPVRLQDDPATVSKFARLNAEEKGYIQVSSPNNGDSYNFAGTQAEVLSGGMSNVPPGRAKFHLMALGMPAQDAQDTLDRAARNGRVTVGNLRTLLTEPEKAAELRAQLIEPLVKNLPPLKTDLIKEASFFGDADTVDSVLSLNFVNLENIATFIDFVPKFKETLSVLAKLLVASRLGFGVVPEDVAKRAMDNLERVVSSLEQLGAAMSVQG